MQCKDIPDVMLLRAIDETPGVSADKDSWRMVWDVNTTLNKLMGKEIDDRLLRAKAEKLIEKELMEGCTCGCRGDFYLTEEGHRLLELSKHESH